MEGAFQVGRHSERKDSELAKLGVESYNSFFMEEIEGEKCKGVGHIVEIFKWDNRIHLFYSPPRIIDHL